MNILDCQMIDGGKLESQQVLHDDVAHHSPSVHIDTGHAGIVVASRFMQGCSVCNLHSPGLGDM